jgi:hypothetical protein|tara:strand:+ start:1260 stop:3227 length:1968 start_codon:yes stop_codon:yes gene_type:complete
MQKKPKTAKAAKSSPKTASKASSASAEKADLNNLEETVASSATPLTAFEAEASTTTRRNKSADINRTDRFKNISDGVVPFKYTYGVSNKSNLNIRDTVILCQKAYYNFAIFRNTIDMMTEFSSSGIFLRGGSRKSRDFFDALFEKNNLKSFIDKFFREYYRSGNVFIYRFDGKVAKEDIKKMTQTFGASKNSDIFIPVRYSVLNPADIQIQGGLNFANGVYYKVLSDYELVRLRDPQTEEDQEILNNLPEQTRELIRDSKANTVLMPLSSDQISAVFYKKQDYEPFSVPMGYPVLEDINWKSEMKKMDMAVARTMQQAILLVTMGTEPEKGGVNQKNLASMQTLFQNESVGRVLIADYTTDAKFVIPNIGNLLGPEKYEVVDRDIQIGLQNILVGDEKFANQAIKTDVFLARLSQAREAFLNEFLIPEIKRVSKLMGFKNYPLPYFNEFSLGSDPTKSRVYSRLMELGILTPEEGINALETDKLPDNEESIESQRKFTDLREEGLYQPIIGGKGDASPTGRPPGTGTPQETKDISPIGEGEQSNAEHYSVSKITDNMILANALTRKVEAGLRKFHKLKRLNKRQKEVAQGIVEVIISNENPSHWNKKVDEYVKKPVDKNEDRVSEIRDIACRHQVDYYLASILFASKSEEETNDG